MFKRLLRAASAFLLAAALPSRAQGQTSGQTPQAPQGGISAASSPDPVLPTLYINRLHQRNDVSPENQNGAFAGTSRDGQNFYVFLPRQSPASVPNARIIDRPNGPDRVIIDEYRRTTEWQGYERLRVVIEVQTIETRDAAGRIIPAADTVRSFATNLLVEASPRYNGAENRREIITSETMGAAVTAVTFTDMTAPGRSVPIGPRDTARTIVDPPHPVIVIDRVGLIDYQVNPSYPRNLRYPRSYLGHSAQGNFTIEATSPNYPGASCGNRAIIVKHPGEAPEVWVMGQAFHEQLRYPRVGEARTVDIVIKGPEITLPRPQGSDAFTPLYAGMDSTTSTLSTCLTVTRTVGSIPDSLPNHLILPEVFIASAAEAAQHIPRAVPTSTPIFPARGQAAPQPARPVSPAAAQPQVLADMDTLRKVNSVTVRSYQLTEVSADPDYGADGTTRNHNEQNTLRVTDIRDSRSQPGTVFYALPPEDRTGRQDTLRIDTGRPGNAALDPAYRRITIEPVENGQVALTVENFSRNEQGPVTLKLLLDAHDIARSPRDVGGAFIRNVKTLSNRHWIREDVGDSFEAHRPDQRMQLRGPAPAQE